MTHPQVKEFVNLFKKRKRPPSYHIITSYKQAHKVLEMDERNFYHLMRKKGGLPKPPFTRVTLLRWADWAHGLTDKYNTLAEVIRLRLDGLTFKELKDHFKCRKLTIQRRWQRALANYEELAKRFPDLPRTKEEVLAAWKEVLSHRQRGRKG